MSNRNRHMQYRKSIYRRRKIRSVLILSISVAVVVFALFIIIGTALHNKTKPEETFDFGTQDQGKETTGLTPTSAIGAYPLPLLQEGSNFSDRLASVPPTASAVCINLNDEAGTLLYRSTLTQEISNLSVATDASDLSTYISSIESNDLYISSVLYVTAFQNENDLVEDVELSIWSAVACEALRAGIGDVLIVVPSLETGDVEKLYAFADRVHAAVPEGIVGVMLSDTILLDEQKTALLDEFNKHFNYMALDTTAFSSEDDPLEYVESKTAKMQLDLMYYKMRVILPQSDDSATQSKYIEIVERYNISSWQILP